MIVETIDQVREAVPVNARMEYETLKPYLQIAEEKFLLQVLGQSFYEKLDDLSSPDDKEEKVLKKCRISAVNYAMWHGFDMLNVTMNDSGFLRADKDTGLYRYQEENLKRRFKNDAFDALDNLIEYLQGNADNFTEFKSSEFYTETKEAFFKNTADFNQIYNINNSRLVFLQFSRFFDRVIDFEIIPTMGQALYKKVVDEMKKDQDQDPDLISLVPFVKKAMAFLSVAYGIDELGLQVTDKGMFFEVQDASSNSNVKESPADADLKQQIYQRARKTGDSYKAMLFEFLRDNSEKYPDFTQLDEETTSNPYRRDNSGKKTFFT